MKKNNESKLYKSCIDHSIEHIIYKIENATLRIYPTPHIYINNIFPDKIYNRMQSIFPDERALKKMQYSSHGNHEIDPRRHYLSYRDGDFDRLAAVQGDDFWKILFHSLITFDFSKAMNKKFFKYLDWPRIAALGQHGEALLMNDLSGYQIGPHTDTPQKIWSSLFYLPADDSHRTLGTSLFSKKNHPKRFYKFTDSWFRFGGDPILNFSDFEKIWTAPYVPNSMFAFVRTRNSYHGVEPSDPGISRKIMIFESFSMKKSRFIGN